MSFEKRNNNRKEERSPVEEHLRKVEKELNEKFVSIVGKKSILPMVDESLKKAFKLFEGR